MQRRTLGRTGRETSVIGLGTWQFGGDWGPVAAEDAFAVMDASAEAGTTLFDTADVYGDGRSEQLIGRWIAAHPEAGVTVATKMGRRVDQVPSNYVAANFRQWVDRSRENLGQDTLDLVQLHCPPTEVFSDDAVYDALDALVADGSIAAYGVSVETADQALTAIARPGVASVQVILNAFRLKPLDRVLPAAREAGVAILARVPLASGLLTGKYTTETTFAPEDHRTYNREGQAFDQGETFSGVPFEDGVRAAQEFAASLPEGVSVPQAALAWVVAQEGVTAAIPGARNAEQARSNAAAGSLDLPADLDATVHELYDRWFRATVHERW
ncbi:aryl-alcohol dehydrogenase-like predicted oxidoreductase [Curtobacterium herbarum]|uniref:aldo/keto reductase n=1 Tax=Curtobacterium TaxID=2034 RepID=UPI00209E12A3|nr:MULTISPECIES: aldo/keto reductase [Curtobacterium]MCP1503534.1 aryl-alcohol dehydrogenase-like predicted oxidoreductase [Curtobacterium herbarum]MDN4649082.1 aldo/keto reductase [Curtobacterium sp. PsM8]MDY1005142.1 aldo/keto reductase [Curtobacterium sp. CFBP9011]